MQFPIYLTILAKAIEQIFGTPHAMKNDSGQAKKSVNPFHAAQRFFLFFLVGIERDQRHEMG